MFDPRQAIMPDFAAQEFAPERQPLLDAGMAEDQVLEFLRNQWTWRNQREQSEWNRRREEENTAAEEASHNKAMAPPTLISDLHLNCWVRGDKISSITEISVPRTSTVASFRRIIKARMGGLDDIHDNALTLYRVSLSAQVAVESFIPTPEQELFPMDMLSNVFTSPPQPGFINIVVVRPPADLRLICWVRGRHPATSVEISMPGNSLVSDLRAVTKARMGGLDDIHETALTLYKVSLSPEAAAKGFTLGPERELGPWEILSDAFTSPPQPRLIHIAVDYPSASKSAFAMQLAHTKIGDLTPSYIGISDYIALQKDVHSRILDHRLPDIDIVGELPDNDVPPIALVYKPFGDFLDICHGRRHNCPSMVSQEMMANVGEFITKVAWIYRNEADRQDICVSLLNKIFRPIFGDAQIMAASIDAVSTNGHIVGPDMQPIFMIEVKNEMVDIRSIPPLQLCSYYQRLVRKVEQSNSKLFRASTLPMLGMTIVGPEITFYAFVKFGRRPHYTPLTPALSCIDRAVGGDSRRKLYDMFIAASILLGHIFGDARSNRESLPAPIADGDHYFPVITQLPSCENTGRPIRFQIIEKLTSNPYRHLYVARDDDDTERRLVIKFSRSYCPELHNHCASRDHAPKLLGFGELPGGFCGIAMELVEGAYNLPGQMDSSPDERKKLACQLKSLVDSFHALDLVHGDLRYPNILHVNYRIVLLDFDWGGKEMEASYPYATLAPELTDGRSETGLMITKEDDKRILDGVFAHLGVSRSDLSSPVLGESC